jgi:hypothetical protein
VQQTKEASNLKRESNHEIISTQGMLLAVFTKKRDMLFDITSGIGLHASSIVFDISATS